MSATPANGSFDPRPREGATHPTRTRPQADPCFDPRPREGATRPLNAAFIFYGFRSAPP